MAGDHHRYTEVLRQPRGCVAFRESEVRVNDVWPPIGPAAAQLASNTARHGQSLQPGGELWNRQIAWIADADIAVDHGLAFNRAPALLSGRPAAKPLGEVRHRHHDANIGMLGQRLRSLQTESTCRGGSSPWELPGHHQHLHSQVVPLGGGLIPSPQSCNRLPVDSVAEACSIQGKRFSLPDSLGLGPCCTVSVMGAINVCRP